MKPWPISIRLQPPIDGMNIGIRAEGGFMLVPEACCMSSMPDMFILPMSIFICARQGNAAAHNSNKK